MKHVMNNSRIEIDNSTLCEIVLDQLDGLVASNYDANGFYKIFADKRGQTFYVLGLYNGLELNLTAYTLAKSYISGKIKPAEIGYLESYNESYMNFGNNSTPTLHISAVYTTGEKNIGIGTALIMSAAEYVRNNTNIDFLSLTSVSESVGFYKKLNFKETDKVIDDCPVMIKDVHDLNITMPTFLYPSEEPEEFEK